MLNRMPIGQRSERSSHGFLLISMVVLGMAVQGGGWCQTGAFPVNTAAAAKPVLPGTKLGNGPLVSEATEPPEQFEGMPVRRISFAGVDPARLAPLPGDLPQKEGAPLSPEKLKSSLRQLFATGLYEDIAVEGLPDGDGVDLVFRGAPRAFIGTVSVEGAKGATLNTQLQHASQLVPGTRYTAAKLSQALDLMRHALAENGFNEPKIAETLTPHPEDQLVDLAFQVVSGPQARVGAVQATGDPGMTGEEFRRHAHLRAGSHVDHDTPSKALAGVLKHYQGDQRLEAEIKLEAQQYVPATRKDDFRFSANPGPIVKVMVAGTSMSQERIKRVIPIYEEGTVDDDLLNEGNRRLRDYYQRLGYFDIKVDHEQQTTSASQVLILYKVQLGPRRRVESVSITGNHYFDSATLKELLSVHPADVLDRHGAFSQALVSADIGALEAVYHNNGFSKVKVTEETGALAAKSPAPGGKTPAIAPLTVLYRIDEGQQLRVGSVRLEGNDHVDAGTLTSLLNTAKEQLLSPQNLAGDRDALFTEYLSRGFRQVQVDISEQVEAADPDKVDVVFHITEGSQIFVRKVLVTGLEYTRPETVERAITLHPGDPLNQSAVINTQRNLYELALFNEVNTAVENPNGGDTQKTVLLQLTEARRWSLTYGFGFEAQTGNPQYNCGGIIASGAPCNPNGKTGVSPRVLGDITRNGLFGRELSASLQGTYGLLEQKINLLFQDPHFRTSRNIGLDFSGGYANSLDVTTYVASKLEGSFRMSEHFDTPGGFLSKANTFIYQLNFRRVKVQANSLQVAPGEIAQESTAVRVAGPAITWIRDTRDSPLDAHRGTYTSAQEFLSQKDFGAQAQFNRLDLSNSSYYSFDKGRLVLARNTRYGQERAFGTSDLELIPLPERLFAGGPTALRGFSVNAAGPRDPETGYPIGGAGALANSTELRLPPPTLPWLGNEVSLVLFHDMGNIFTNASDVWASAIRTRQPNRDSCKNLDIVNPQDPNAPPSGPVTSTGWQGQCSFNYFSHAPGVGVRYHTPVGPIRVDFSYNLNPPIYPVIYNYSLQHANSDPHVGEAGHFNFFFSLGQTF